MKILSILLTIVLGFMVIPALPNNNVEEKTIVPTIGVADIERLSWMVATDDGYFGSSVMITRKRGEDYIHFNITAAHVLGGHEEVWTAIDPKTGTPRVYTRYRQATILRQFNEDGKKAGQIVYDADIIRFSQRTQQGKDLAVLQVRKKNITKETVKFLERNKLPTLGEAVWHIGSMTGPVGINSLSEGVVSGVGRVRGSRLLDQTNLLCEGGSSGGGIFLKKNGRCLGLMLENINNKQSNLMLFLPSREIYDWAKATNCLWLVDHTVPLPSDEEIRATPVNDIPIPMSAVNKAKDKK